MICSNGTKESVTYPDDLLLGTVIRECADHGIIVQNSQYLVTKEDDRALNLNRSLADNDIVDGDVLYVGSVTKAVANNEVITVTFWLNSLRHDIHTVSNILSRAVCYLKICQIARIPIVYCNGIKR